MLSLCSFAAKLKSYIPTLYICINVVTRLMYTPFRYVSKRHANQNTVVQNLKTECEKFTQPLQNLSIQDTSSLLDDATETADTSIADEEVESILNNVSHHDEDGPSSRSSSVVSMPVDMTTDVKSDQSFDNRGMTQ